MSASSQNAGKLLPLSSRSSSQYQSYSTVGDASAAWSHLLSSKVFQSEDKTPTVDLIDAVDPYGQPGTIRKVTFDNAGTLDLYLASNPMKCRTRFM